MNGIRMGDTSTPPQFSGWLVNAASVCNTQPSDLPVSSSATVTRRQHTEHIEIVDTGNTTTNTTTKTRSEAVSMVVAGTPAEIEACTLSMANGASVVGVILLHATSSSGYIDIATTTQKHLGYVTILPTVYFVGSTFLIVDVCAVLPCCHSSSSSWLCNPSLCSSRACGCVDLPSQLTVRGHGSAHVTESTSLGQPAHVGSRRHR